MRKYLLTLCLALAGVACATDAAPCTCEPAEIVISNANDSGVQEGPLLDVLRYGCSVSGDVTPPLECTVDVITVECAGDTLTFEVDRQTCTALLVSE